MKEEIKQFKKTEKALIKKLKVWVTNKQIPLDDRWNLFIESELGEEEYYVQDFGCKIGIDYNEDELGSGNYNRHSVIEVENILDWAKDNNYSDKETIKFKEAVLKAFTKSFKHDW